MEFIPKPDLVPEDDSIAEEYSESNDEEKENSVQVQSFISDKMISEFHVKTREHSKSSLNLHQFLNFGKPIKDKKAVFKKNISFEDSKTVFPLKQISHKDSLDLDDLPYSNVRDSILADSGDRCEESNCDLAIDSFIPTAENIYAEIFQGTTDKTRPTSSNTFAEDYEFQEAIDFVEDVSDKDSVFALPTANDETNADSFGAYEGSNIYNTLK